MTRVADKTTIPGTTAQLTVLSSEYPKDLTKQILLDKDGNMIKQPSANLAKGTAELVSVQSMQDFSELLQSLETNQALVYGVPSGALSKAKVVTKKVFESLDDTEGTITRSNDHFDWPEGPGIMMFDYDPDGEALGKEAVLQLLYDVCPEIKDVNHLWWTSSSSNITNDETGEQLSSVTGQRIYVMVQEASDIPRAAEVIAQKLWLADHGDFKVSKAGCLLDRVPFDMSIYQPCRLDFAAGASTVPPLIQDREEPTLIKGTKSVLNTGYFLGDLMSDDIKVIEVKKRSKEAVANLDAADAREAFVRTMKTKIAATAPHLDDVGLQSEIRFAIEDDELSPYWPLHVWNGSKLVEMTVASVIDQKHTYHGCLCLDPLEPDYDGGRLVGKLYLDQKNPVLYSFARGERKFFLCDHEYEVQLKARLHDATNGVLSVLEKKQVVFNYGGVLAAPFNGKLQGIERPIMLHILSGLFQFKDGKIYCDPSNRIADGVLAVGVKEDVNPIKGFIDHPIMDGRLRILDRQGYNKKMKLLGRFDHTEFDYTDRVLSDHEVLYHINRVYAPFTGFDIAGPDNKSVLLAAVFSAVFRQALLTCPAFGFDAPMQGSGKTLLGETIAMIGSGVMPAALAPGRNDYDEEFRKRLLCILMDGDKVCLFDNIVGEFDSPSLAAAITSGTYQDRILKSSKSPKVLVKTLFLFTGNNLRFNGDMSRRVLRARLKPKNGQLTKREYHFHPVSKAKTTRKEIISSVLSLVNHWKHCGQVKQPGSMTSFDDWDTLVRQPLAFIAQTLPQTGLVDVLDVSVRQQEDSGDKEALIALLIAIAAIYGEGRKFKATSALNSMRDNGHCPLTDAVLAFIPRERLQSSMHLGSLLKQFKDRNVDGLVLRAKQVSGSWSYWVELTDDTHRQAISMLSARDYGPSASNDPNLAA
jgi:hypothetical protein